MAIIKSDCLLLLYELLDSGIDCTAKIKLLAAAKDPSLEIIKYINDNKELECRKFYEKIRKSYNDKHSQLFINIVKEDLEPKDILTCLASLNLQILLFNKSVENSSIFLRLMRFEEIQKVMLNYAKTGDIIPCLKLIGLFRADLKVLEELSKN